MSHDFFTDPTAEQIDCICSFVENEVVQPLFTNATQRIPQHLFINISEHIWEITKEMPTPGMVDFFTLVDFTCRNYCEASEMFSLDDYMSQEIYVPILTQLQSEGMRNAHDLAMRVTDAVTLKARMLMQDVDNMLTTLSVPHVEGFGSVWRPVQITAAGILHLACVDTLTIQSETNF